MIRTLILGVTVSSAIVLAGASAAFADSTGSTGQPSQSCQAQPPGSTPGNSASAPGSAFNPSGVAGTHYAGNAPQNSNNPKSVSQYDVACFQQASH
jgi:hypothetical protein